MIRTLTIVLACAVAVPAQAGFYADRYCTTVSDRDRVNSQGVRLTTVAQILQNERANFHLGRHRDPGDQSDDTFAHRENRFEIATILGADSVGPFLKDDLVQGQGPVNICVMLEGSDFPSPDLQIEVWRNE